MPQRIAAVCLGFFVLFLAHARTGVSAGSAEMSEQPAYTADGKMLLPASYREWVYLSTGLNMSYSEQPRTSSMSAFDNVFVNPAAYKQFLATGTWPDKTMLVLEIRGAGSAASINKQGNFQTSELMGVEVHVKDTSRFKTGWGFFGFGEGRTTAEQTPEDMPCYSCHQEHGAVETTFVQFYPTLLSIAKEKHTLSAAYLKETAAK